VFTQPLTEMRNINRKIMYLGSRVRPVCRADNLTAICEPVVYSMQDSEQLTTLEATMASYEDSSSTVT
jgi:hypothetical protein